MTHQEKNELRKRIRAVIIDSGIDAGEAINVLRNVAQDFQAFALSTNVKAFADLDVDMYGKPVKKANECS